MVGADEQLINDKVRDDLFTVMGMGFIENPSRDRQTGVTDLKEGTNPPDLFPIGLLLRDLLCQMGKANQIFLRGIR
jgi:hypothetical protein